MGSQGDGSCYKLVLLWMGREGFGERPRFVGDGLFGFLHMDLFFVVEPRAAGPVPKWQRVGGGAAVAKLGADVRGRRPRRRDIPPIT